MNQHQYFFVLICWLTGAMASFAHATPIPVLTASIGNFVWEDINGNGIQDAGESGIGGVSITLSGTTQTGTPVNLTTTSDQTGAYLFSQLEAGTYRLTFSAAGGYVATSPNIGADESLDSDINPSGTTDDEVLTDGENNMTYDAGYYRPASMGNFVWEDSDANGLQEAGEPGINGVAVVLTGTRGSGVSVSLTTTTDAAGLYLFSNLSPGTYKVTFTTPAGYTATAPDQGANDASDSDANRVTGMTLNEVLTSGEINNNYDAGYYRPGSMGNFVWEDVNGNGIQDSGEPGINGVTVVLSGTTGSGGPVSLMTTTDAAGLYLFSNLDPGTYKVTFTTPTGYTAIAPDQGGDDALDSDANRVTGMTLNEVLTSGEINNNYDAGYYRYSAIGNFVWEDVNGNGIQDAGEPGIAGVTVVLSGTTGSGAVASLSTTTNAAGLYLFSNLDPGTYRVTFTAPIGYTATAPDQGANDASDSDANRVTGMALNEVLTSGEINTNYDAGYYKSSAIGNFVWEDVNGNGIQDAGEPGIAQVTVILTGTTGSGVPFSVSTTTNAAGLYLFSNLDPGTYRVTFTAPIGYTATAPDQGANDASDSDANRVTGMALNEVLTSGEINTNYDAGYYKSSAIGNFVWEDVNGNGIQEAGEPGIANVVVVLSGTTGSGGPVSLTTTTNVAGLYLFSNLDPGTYKLTFTSTPDYRGVARDQGTDDTKDSDADPVTGLTSIEVLTSGKNNMTYDAGYVRRSFIEGRVWFDANHDGIQNIEEGPIADVEVILTGSDVLGNPVSFTTVTNAQGRYRAYPQNTNPGTYKITFSPFSGMTYTAPDQGNDDTLDSDANALTGIGPVLSMQPDDRISHIDAGLHGPVAQWTGRVIYDENKNCALDSTEQGLSDFLLEATNGSVTYHTLSGPDGQYYMYVPPGTWQLTARSSLPVTPCPLPPLTFATPGKKDSLNVPVKDVLPCGRLQVDISTLRLQRCFDSYYYVNYANMGVLAVEGTYIVITLDSLLHFKQASIPHIALGDNRYRFDIGTLSAFEKGKFSIRVEVSCSAVLGQAHCTEAEIFPDKPCAKGIDNWQGALLKATARCENRTEVVFVLKNIGKGDMKEGLEFIVIEDGVMGKPLLERPLAAGDSIVVRKAANGSTWRIEARQERNYPGPEIPVATLEGCTTKGTFSTGFVSQYPHDEKSLSNDVDCSINVGSHDPNDKQGMPVGYGENRYITPGTEIEYMIRFENTGTDTAFSVVVVDTIAPTFDLSQLRMGPSSHPYTYTLSGPGQLTFRFPNIQLPPKKTNPEAAQGFVRYALTPRADLPLPTALANRAHIFFDFNESIQTNTTRHKVGKDFISVSVQQPVSPTYTIIARPNPFWEAIEIRLTGDMPPARSCLLRLYHPSGQLMLEQRENAPVFEVQTANFPQGVYFYRVFCDGQAVAAGNVVKM